MLLHGKATAMLLPGAQPPCPSLAVVVPMSPRKLLQYCMFAMTTSVRPDPLWTQIWKAYLVDWAPTSPLLNRVVTHQLPVACGSGVHNRNSCLGFELDSKWNWEMQTGDVLTNVFTNVVQLLALFLIDDICNFVSALLHHSEWGGPVCGYVPCSDISKAWSSEPQYCKIHVNLLLYLFPWWLTNDVGCVFECQPSPE